MTLFPLPEGVTVTDWTCIKEEAELSGRSPQTLHSVVDPHRWHFLTFCLYIDGLPYISLWVQERLLCFYPQMRCYLIEIAVTFPYNALVILVYFQALKSTVTSVFFPPFS